MKGIIILLLVFTFISSKVDLESLIFSQFQKFIKKYHKKYSSMQEFLSLFQVFRLNLKETLNSSPENYITGITQFSDLTRQEFAKKYLNTDFPVTSFLIESKPLNNLKAAPDSWDWREHSICDHAPDQGSCNAGYIFSTLCNLESLYNIKKG